MTTGTVIYLGGLKSQCTHTRSGANIFTDAPVDNQGKGEAFSPTDLCALALATCILTSMGIYAEKKLISIAGASSSVIKEMSTEPRRIGKIIISFSIPGKDLTEEHKEKLVNVAVSCPAYLSLHPDIEKDLRFTWI